MVDLSTYTILIYTLEGGTEEYKGSFITKQKKLAMGIAI